MSDKMNDCPNCLHKDNNSGIEPCLSCETIGASQPSNWEPIKMNESTDTSQQLIADYEEKIKALTEDRDVWKDAAQQISKAFTAMKEKKDGEPSRVAELEEELKKVEASLNLSDAALKAQTYRISGWKLELEAKKHKIKKLKKAFLKMV